MTKTAFSHCLFFMMFLSIRIAAQNLVPNPGFEDYNNCPSSFSDISYAPGYNLFPTVKAWINPLKTTTPDYYNACAPAPSLSNSSVHVPANTMGYQKARTGNAYAGIVPYSGQWGFNYSEYIECRLLQPLVAGHTYDVEFYVSFTYKTEANPYRNYVAVKRMGIHFSDTLIYSPGPLAGDQVLHLQYSVGYSGGFITDTMNWVKISGVYTALGGEQYLTLGTFEDGNPVTFQHVFPVPASTLAVTDNSSYYYIDDISVKEQVTCDTVINKHDTVACLLQPFRVQLSAADMASSYLWNTGATTKQYTIENEGKYWCVATGVCDLYIDTFMVRSHVSEKTITESVIVCPGSTTVLSSTNAGVKHTWSTGDTTRTINIKDENTYRCKSIDVNCILLTEIFPVSILANTLHLDLGRDTTICAGDHFILSGGKQYVQYRWNTGDSTCCIRPGSEGIYALTISNACYSLADSVTIEMERCNDCMFIPSAFSPNADGLNDRFSVIEKCPLEDYKMAIYNRWGEQVFVSNDRQHTWDGTHKGQPVLVGAYYYYVQYTVQVNKKKVLMSGDVTVVR